MTSWRAVIFFAFFSTSFGQSQYTSTEQKPNPIIVTTTVTTITDLNTGLSRSFHSVSPPISAESLLSPGSSVPGGSGFPGSLGLHGGMSGMYGMYSGYPGGYTGSYGGNWGGAGGIGGIGEEKYPYYGADRSFLFGGRRPFGPTQMSRPMLEGLGIPGVLHENQVRLLNSSWNILKRKPDFAPKVFLRYFKIKPEAQKYFPEIANIPIGDLPNNRDFLFRVYTCINSLNLIIPYLNASFPESYPAFANLKDKYNEIDLKRFGGIFMAAMQEELGNNFTPEVRDAWKKAILAITDYASQSPQQPGTPGIPSVQPNQ